MAEYIERAKVFEAYNDEQKKSGCWRFETLIESIPAEDVELVVHGRWEMNSDRPDMIICTVCNAGFDVWKHEAKDFNYCPSCGAKMEEAR